MAGDSKNNGNGESWTLGSGSRSANNTLEQTDTVHTLGRLKLRGKTDDLPQDWWFASTAIPLMAATIGPMANVLSIAALVSTWRVTLPNNGQLPDGTDENGTSIPDPHWEIVLNAISLACGFFGNLALLLNFTRRIRYIVALPATIISWYFATGILIGITAAMNIYVPPVRPGETYSQGFWHAVIAATLYMVGSMMLMINMLGYFLGHYPQHFDLDDDQRTLILQTMMFFFWLAGGAAVFSRVCGFSYADALYFCDVTVLTVGFGDLFATNDVGRGLIFPYSVFGIIFLGLMINSIRKFAASMSKDKVIRRHQLDQRERTFGRTVTSEKELRDRLGLPPKMDGDLRRQSSIRRASTGTIGAARKSLEQYGHFDVHGRTIVFHEHRQTTGGGRGGAGRTHKPKVPLSRDAKMQVRKEGKSAHIKRHDRRQKLILLKEEKDRFDAMREIQANTSKFKQYYALSMSVLAFGLLWCVGAAVFYVAEHRIQKLSYFDSLYFCYVSLLTIGYGDLAPKSNAGKPFFVVWSLVAVPTITILVSDMGDTVISAINRGTFTLADWTIMPKAGVWADFLSNHPKLKDWLELQTKKREEKKRLRQGFPLQNPDEEANANEAGEEEDNGDAHPTLEKLAEEPAEISEHDLARKLAVAIKRVANDLRADHPKKYSYEEWAGFTRLIRFSRLDSEEVEQEEEEEGLIEWDWIGEDSPMLAEVSESEWILDRLCESLNRYTRKQARETRKRKAERAVEAAHHHDRERFHHDIGIYPAHPGPRSPFHAPIHSPTSASSSVLSRSASGEQSMQLFHKNRNDKSDTRSESGISPGDVGGSLEKIMDDEAESSSAGGSASRKLDGLDLKYVGGG